MARDYKNSATKPKVKQQPRGSWASFISGLGLGLIVALAVHFRIGALPHDRSGTHDAASVDESTSLSNLKFDEQTKRVVPKFDFYKILPEVEIKVPAWEITTAARKDNPALSQGTYVLQVGSYKQYADADRAKAKLALRGIQAKIHRVVINGQDIWYRVHVGPYTDFDSIQAMRAKIIEAGNDYILLKIGDGAG